VIWRYTTNAPAIGWEDNAFDDRDWSSREAGFGTDVPNNRTRSAWTTDDIWLRTTFEADHLRLDPLKLVVYHDEDVEIYLNGQRVWSESGYIVNYKEVRLPDEVLRRLKPVGNRIAVHCHQTTGGQYIDVGLSQGSMPLDTGVDREHNLLLNGPKN
jgi:beta-galactosidase